MNARVYQLQLLRLLHELWQLHGPAVAIGGRAEACVELDHFGRALHAKCYRHIWHTTASGSRLYRITEHTSQK